MTFQLVSAELEKKEIQARLSQILSMSFPPFCHNKYIIMIDKKVIF